jgi:hypothetical protein
MDFKMVRAAVHFVLESNLHVDLRPMVTQTITKQAFSTPKPKPRVKLVLLRFEAAHEKRTKTPTTFCHVDNPSKTPKLDME